MKKRRSISAIKFLILLFVMSSVVHCILNVLIKDRPIVIIDEGLYTNIARSLAWRGELAFRGQPIEYPYLLYPILLVPIYWLNRLLGGDVYRYIQVFNTLMITSSIIPVYFFARDFTKDQEKACLTSIIVAIMPDMLMGGFSMTECIIWPLALWMTFFAYRYYTEKRLKYGLLTAVFSGLMFFAKPGAIAVGGMLLAIRLVTIRKNEKQRIKQLLITLVLLGAIVIAVYGIYLLLFGHASSLLGLYTKQTSEWKSKDALVAIEATLLTVFLFIIACGGVYGVIPFAFIKQYEKQDRGFIKAYSISVLSCIIGTAVFVVPFKWNSSLGVLPLHLRYCAMYVPAFIVFSEKIDIEKERKNNKFLLTVIILAVLIIFPGVRSGFVQGRTNIIDSMILAAFITTKRLDGNIVGWVLTSIILMSFLHILYAFRGGQGKKIQVIATGWLLVITLFNMTCACINVNVYIDPTITKDAIEVNQWITGRECLGITQRYYDDIRSYWLDAQLNEPMQQVTIDQMFVKMQEMKGIYTPFIPVEQAPNVNNHETPDTDTLVLGMTIAEHLETSEYVEVSQTTNGHFSMVKMTPGMPWVDTMMYGLDDNLLYEDTPGYIHIYIENRNIDGLIKLRITASGNGNLIVGGSTISLTEQMRTYELSVPFTTLLTMKAEGGNAEILTYETESR